MESVYGLRLDGTLMAYPSYVNRVYGLRSDDGERYIVKFYRPGRWSYDAVLEEHLFVADCAAAELPVVAPIGDEDGDTLHTVTADGKDVEQEYDFALYPLRGGRNFDAERDEDWLRIGALLGRMHSVASEKTAMHRIVCTPSGSTTRFLDELRSAEVVHPECMEEFFTIADTALKLTHPLFAGIVTQRIHGDFHRGNLLERPDQGLMAIDFDDMMTGPPVQDIWLMLPGRKSESQRELNLILEGYEQFLPFDYFSVKLVEPLRLMRMIYYLAWQNRQRNDRGFRNDFPAWGGEAFWIKEIEDLRTQLEVIAEEIG